MLGVWPLATEQGRESLAFLIAHMPCDGRYEVVIREITHPQEQPDASRPVHDQAPHGR